MNAFIEKISHIFRDKNLRKRVLFVVIALVLFRLLTVIPIPGIDTAKLASLFANSQFLGLLNIFSGGGLANLSIVMLGVGPYITASIIMQLLTMMSPKFKAMYHEEGELGRRKFTQYSRLLAIPLAVLQGYGLVAYLAKQGILVGLTPFDMLLNTVIVAAGSMLLMWIGELISEFGVGNGVSLIIFAGIVAILPAQLSQLIFTFDISQLTLYIGAIVSIIVVIASVVFVTEAERPIPITYAKQARGGRMTGGSSYIPLRLNQAGVIPIIFALSILTFPTVIANILVTFGSGAVQAIAGAIQRTLAND